jgi:hypothetical protein
MEAEGGGVEKGAERVEGKEEGEGQGNFPSRGLYGGKGTVR